MMGYILAPVFWIGIISSITKYALSGTCNNMGSNSFVHQNAPSPAVCYWVSTSQTNITGANTICLSQGGFLALVPDSTANGAVKLFMDSKGLGSSEVYLGYDVDTTTSAYRLTTLSGQEQTYKNFYSTNTYSAEWHCVSMYISSWFPEQCTKSYHFLCSNISNLAAPPSSSTTIQTTTHPQSTETSSSTTTATLSTSTTPTTSTTPPTTATSTTPPTTTATTATSATSTTSTCICPTNCVVSYTATINSTEELNSKIAEIKKEIEVEKSTLSSNIRKKTSADDPRPSAKTVGCIGIVLIAVVIGGIVALDFPRLVIALKHLIGKVLNILKK